MDVLIKFYSLSFTLFLFVKGISSFEAVQSVSPELPVFGENGFTLQCAFTMNNGEVLSTLYLKRKRTGETVFTDIITFPPALSTEPVKIDSSIERRVVVTEPDYRQSSSVKVVFNNTLCTDMALYMWDIDYYLGGYNPSNRTSDVKIKVIGSLEALSGYGITSTLPGYDVEVGTNVTVTCKADVGAEPQGELEWDYYTTDTSDAYPVSVMASKTGVPPDISCSSGQESVLTLPMTADLNGIYIRCTLKQGGVPNKFSVTSNSFNVRYSARQTAVNPNPPGPEYTEGDAQVTLTCNSRANPAPSYTWVLPNGTVVAGVTYTLQNLQINDTGSYTCVAKNGVPDENATDSKIFQLTVNEKTTTTTTTTSSTTPARSSTTPKNGGGNAEKSTEDDGPSDTTIIIIVVCVVVGVGIIVAIIIICICKRNKKQEIEEPPEKPRNNQDLTFYGNSRPGLTTSNEQLKNSGNNLNTSFNSFDSTDSKPHNPDGLMYSELQFEDKPRSRRPIQILDNGSSTPYADIAMPRV